MRILIFIFFLIFCSSEIFSQDTIYLKNEFDTVPSIKDKASYYKIFSRGANSIEVNLFYINGVKVAKYHTRPESLNRYEGVYERYYYNGNINLKGIFNENKMEGEWLLYNKEKGYVEEKRNYKNNLQDGKRYTLYESGKEKKVELYSKDTFISMTCYDTAGTEIECKAVVGQDVKEMTETMPTYPGGLAALILYLKNAIQYPIQAAEKNVEGKVVVKFYIDVDGSVKSPFIIKDETGGLCAAEAIRVCSSMPRWIPGMQKGKPVKVYYIIPVTFKLN